MKRFAANRVLLFTDQTLVRNGVVEIDETTHHVTRIFSLDEEIQQTEWKGGIILISDEFPHREEGETFAAYVARLQKKERPSELTSLYAYHVTAFDVSSMEFTAQSRIVSL